MNTHETWKEALSESPFLESRFSEQLRQEIKQKARRCRKPKYRFVRRGILAAIAIAGLIAWAATDWGRSVLLPIEQDANPANVVRTRFVQGGTTLFEVFPESELVAGVRQGLMIHFTEPIDTFSGKQLSIDATLQETGKQVVVVPPQRIEEPSPGYSGLERFTASFSLPVGGLWTFEVKLDGQRYGDFVLSVKEPPSPWQESPTFELPIGAGGEYILIGEQGKFGFLIGPYQIVAGERQYQIPVVAGKPNKYMWFLWGDKDSLKGSLTVTAVKEGSQQEIGVFTLGLGSSSSLADAQVPSTMKLPEPGMWRLNVYVGNRLFGCVFVRVDANSDLK